MSAVLGSRAGRTSNAETAEAARRLLVSMKRDRLTLVHACDRALIDLHNGVSPRQVAVGLADVLDQIAHPSVGRRAA